MFNDILSISFIVISIGVWIVTIYRLKESKYQLFNVIEKVFKGIEVVYKRHKIAVLATTASLFFVLSILCFAYGIPTLEELQHHKLSSGLSGLITLGSFGIFALSLVVLNHEVKELKKIKDFNDEMIILSNLFAPLLGIFFMFANLNKLRNQHYGVYKMLKTTRHINKKAFKQHPVEMNVLFAMLFTLIALAAYFVKIPLMAINFVLSIAIFLLYRANHKMQKTPTIP